MAVCLETHGHEDKFWNLGPMPTGPVSSCDSSLKIPTTVIVTMTVMVTVRDQLGWHNNLKHSGPASASTDHQTRTDSASRVQSDVTISES